MLPTIDTVNISKFKGISTDYKDICTLELTITTGLEEVAAQECKEKLSVDPVACRGRVIFDIDIVDVPKVLKLRSVDNVNVMLNMESNFQLSDDRDTCFKKIFKFSGAPDWQKGIQVWQTVFKMNLDDPFQWQQSLKDNFCVPRPEIDLRLLKMDSCISGNLPENLINSIVQKNKDSLIKNLEKNCGDNKNVECQSEKEQKQDVASTSTQRVKSGGPKFRVSCHRVGANHKFGSPEAARQFGGGINEMFGWPVDLNNFDVEVLLSIIQDFVYVGISLTKEALFKRNISHFGPTNLRATICYNMLRLAKLEAGDIVIDPMCGGCSIPIEGTLTYKNCLHLGGDNFPLAVNRSRQNIDFLTKNNKMCVDVAQWDVTRLPLRDQLADVVVCDLPFGKRCGSKVDNRTLYYKSLVELARVTRVQTGRAVLLTHDRNSMIKNLSKVKKLWKNFSTRTINIGGLAAGIFLLQRTNLLKDDSLELKTITNSGRRSQKRKYEPLGEILSPQKDL